MCGDRQARENKRKANLFLFWRHDSCFGDKEWNLEFWEIAIRSDKKVIGSCVIWEVLWKLEFINITTIDRYCFFRHLDALSIWIEACPKGHIDWLNVKLTKWTDYPNGLAFLMDWLSKQTYFPNGLTIQMDLLSKWTQNLILRFKELSTMNKGFSFNNISISHVSHFNLITKILQKYKKQL